MIQPMRTLGHQARHNYEDPVIDSVVTPEQRAHERDLAIEMWRRSAAAGRVLGDPDLVELRARRTAIPAGGAACSRVYRVEGPVLTPDGEVPGPRLYRCDAVDCPGFPPSIPMHEVEEGPEFHADCRTRLSEGQVLGP